MFKQTFMLGVLGVLAACTTAQLPRVHCDGHLQPINSVPGQSTAPTPTHSTSDPRTGRSDPRGETP